jgi:hypothetical protein
MISPVRRGLLSAAVMSITGFFALPAASVSASFIQIPLPDSAYTSSTTLIPITGSDGDTLLSLSDGTLTVTFSTLMQEFTAGSSWSSWGSPPAVETSTPRVLSPVDFTLTTVTLAFSQPLTTFGLEAEPDAFTQGNFPVTLDFFNGVTLLGSVSNSLDGSTAALFAASSTTPITSVTLTISGNANDPAGTDPGIAQLRYALAAAPQSVPEGGPSIWLAVISVLVLLMVHRFGYARS